ncbi:MAG: transcription antitermination factor NusB [Alphaproteobacteria bacterium]|nr:transcription antitermination factor NusB [Alphaproteobacteria bacterium]
MSDTKRATIGSLRRGSRVAAVQALYQMALSGSSSETVIAEFTNLRVGRSAPSDVPDAVDEALFADIVRGVTTGRDTIDPMIGAALDKARSLERLEILMQAILRAGVYELLERDDIDPALTINEYVAVADAFFNEREPALVNAVLDRIAQNLKIGEPAAEPVHDVASDR